MKLAGTGLLYSTVRCTVLRYFFRNW